jgi:hypothetical protein
MRKPKSRAKLATAAQLGLSSYDLPDMIMPRGKRLVEAHMRAEGVRNARRIRAGKPPIDMIRSLAELMEETKDPEARAQVQRELKKLQAPLDIGTKQLRNLRASPLAGPAGAGAIRSTRKIKAQRGVVIPATRPVRERGVVPRNEDDQFYELFRLWRLEPPEPPEPGSVL